ncbi:ATP-binding protein [Xanthomonas campestris pv. phormiicola]|nr:ATP-binding protein [Xanthomonas campestris pv. phormiicola]
MIDTGIGIAPQHYQTIFQAFHRLEGAAGNDGLGLGLSIVATMARRLGHSVTVLSREGRGSAFRLRLPLAKPVESHRAIF